MKIIIDPGHGGKDTGAVALGTTEKKLNLILAALLAQKLEQLSIDVDKTLINDTYYDSTKLTDIIKNSDASICISCHNNSANGSASGTEIIHSIHSNGKLASQILDEIKKTGFPIRNIYSREGMGPSNKGKDYYYVIRLTYPVVETIIIEFGFIDNQNDLKLLNDPLWQNKLCTATAEGIRKYLPPEINTGTKIIGNEILQPQQLKKALIHFNSKWNDSIVDLYYSIGDIYGIKPDMAFLQAAHETNWFNFTGNVKATQNNFAGLGSTGNGNAGLSFSSKEAGVEAHFQHLFAYCCTLPLPAGRKLYDSRFNYVQRGVAPTWEKLNGRWAVPGLGYGENIINLQKYVLEKYPLQNDPPVPPSTNTPHWAKQDNDELMKLGILQSDHSSTLDKPATEGIVIALINRLRKEFLKNG